MTQATGNLILSNITKSYDGPEGPSPVLKDVSLTVAEGETVSIVGPSGSGKSTLLNIIGSLDKPTTGTVRLGDIDVSALEKRSLADFRASQVGFVFQDHHLLPQLTALENVLLPTIVGDRNDAAGRGYALLERVGVERRADAFPAQMSGGERQRVAVARALINGGRLLLCDEPTGSLDREAGANTISLLLELAEQKNVTVVMVTHNVEYAARFGRCLELRDGRLAAFDAGTEVDRRS